MCGVAQSDGALRDEAAGGGKEPRCCRRACRPMDRPRSRAPSTEGRRAHMDSGVSPTHGEQENSVWNGHYECTCYQPLFVSNQFGDLERYALRPGNVHSADGWERR